MPRRRRIRTGLLTRLSRIIRSGPLMLPVLIRRRLAAALSQLARHGPGSRLRGL